MKRFIIIILALPCLFSFQPAQKKKIFELSGYIQGRNNQRVQLVKDYYGDAKVLATDTVRNNTFHLTCEVTEVMPVSILFNVNKNSMSYTAIVEEGSVKFTEHENGLTDIQGGKYNQLLLGYQRMKSFAATADSLQVYMSPAAREKLKGSPEEWKIMDMFMRKQALRSDYLEKVMNHSKDTRAKVMAAILLELQPDSKKAMSMVNKAAPELGEQSFLVKKARKINQEQEEATARRQAVMVGKPFADFTATTLAGDSVHLAPVIEKNKYTLLQFWASWCIPCRKEIPLLKKIYAANHAKGLEIISFSLDDNKANWQKASDFEKMNWSNLSDLKAMESKIVRNYSVSSIPANVIIDRDGKIIASNLVGDDLEKKIHSLFN